MNAVYHIGCQYLSTMTHRWLKLHASQAQRPSNASELWVSYVSCFGPSLFVKVVVRCRSVGQAGVNGAHCMLSMSEDDQMPLGIHR